MTISSANMVYEMRANGDATNGGGFLNGGTGTDYSQQDAAQVTYTDLVIDAATNTDVTSAATPFTSAHVGNTINITGGTGFTVARYEVISVAGVIATLSSAVGTVASTGGAGKLGGAIFLWTDVFLESLTAGNVVWVKADGVHVFTENLAVSKDGLSTAYIVINGYDTTRGDGEGNQNNRPSLACGIYSFSFDNYWKVSNFSLTGEASTMLRIDLGGKVNNCSSVNNSSISVRSAMRSGSSNFVAISCSMSSLNGTGILLSSNCSVINCYIHDCGGTANGGVVANGSNIILNNNIFNNCYNGVFVIGDFIQINGCTVYNCTRGLYFDGAADSVLTVKTIIDTCTTGMERATVAPNDAANILENINFSNNTTDKTNTSTIINETNLDPQFVNAAAGDFETGSNMEMTYTWPGGLTSTTIKNGAVQSRRKEDGFSEFNFIRT